ncbi:MULTISPECIES: LysR substrate-binding domain-containing protein [Citrobacter]|uniref:LysR substrate-binding domain-containing protein n=1 Tax=Citrobacter TaxID=544 RepID=UPI0006BA534A|nr:MULTISPECIES: LysR substrate-binding domain-containing protein [Citrobacter]ELB4227071.1 LysR family transcriptional regulator [Citrobacter amalonaticus]ELB4230491.1 LysR family transcriptional regulator [Citrobacter amalonaticus]MDM3524438.1 LysR substrate-binding domain-containing protein [Citrobacter sp. Ca226]MDM3525620.1 LysR substrate-binding domain-containing protein [Citrobacter sp. Ca226]UYF53769.1 LysR substrate-binding domain-containing protein [Citrobacter amalonaticus]
MNNPPLLTDLRVFMLVARRAGFAAVAQELGVSPAYVSKRIALLEQNLNVVLLHRTTRRVTITEEGERIYEWAQRILHDVDQMMDELSDVRQVPQGMLRIISSFGFGRQVVAPALSALARQYPQLELRFDVEDRLVDLANEGVDLDIRIGDDIAPNLIARKLGTNYRILCASPSFLAQHGTLKQLADLATCSCLVIKERDHPFGIWQLQNKEGEHAIKVTGPLSSNHGEIVHQWCLDGQGIALRSWWDVCDNIASGHLVHVLPEYYQPANIWAVYVSRLATSAKVRITVEFLRHYFAERYPAFSLK